MPDLKVLFFLFILLVSSSPYAQDDHKLQQLLAPFADTKYLKLSYQEKRYSFFFKQPQVYQGYIEYISPDTFIKQVQNPARKKFVIVNDQLTLYNYVSKPVSKSASKSASKSDSKPIAIAKASSSKMELPGKKVVSLDEYPQFKQLKALFSGLFKGQAAELTRHYRYEINSLANEQTQLILKSHIADPFTQNNLQKNNIAQQIEVFFHNNRITKIIMTGLGGEKSELLFGPDMIKEK